jgi:cytochrome P450
LVSGAPEQSDRVTLVQRLLRYYAELSSDTASDRDIVSEHMGHLYVSSAVWSSATQCKRSYSVGACDTTSTTLSYLCWELSRRADIAGKLQAELDAVIHDCKIFPDISVLQDLPYLSAFVREGLPRFYINYLSCNELFEGLRLYSAAPSLLERVVPDSSAKTAVPEAFDLMGYALPPKTLVATQAWSAHRNPSVFPSPESFLPERWLETADNREQLEAMNRHMMPFGTGSRVCGGQNLAQMVLRIAITAIARNFDVVTPPETTETSMEMRDSFVCHPFRDLSE